MLQLLGLIRTLDLHINSVNTPKHGLKIEDDWIFILSLHPNPQRLARSISRHSHGWCLVQICFVSVFAVGYYCESRVVTATLGWKMFFGKGDSSYVDILGCFIWDWSIVALCCISRYGHMAPMSQAVNMFLSTSASHFCTFMTSSLLASTSGSCRTFLWPPENKCPHTIQGKDANTMQTYTIQLLLILRDAAQPGSLIHHWSFSSQEIHLDLEAKSWKI